MAGCSNAGTLDTLPWFKRVCRAIISGAGVYCACAYVCDAVGVLRATLRVVYGMDLRAEYLPLVVVFIFTCCSNGEATYIVYTGVFVYSTSICSATCLCSYCVGTISWLYALTNQQPYNSMYQAHTLDFLILICS